MIDALPDLRGQLSKAGVSRINVLVSIIHIIIIMLDLVSSLGFEKILIVTEHIKH